MLCDQPDSVAFLDQLRAAQRDVAAVFGAILAEPGRHASRATPSRWLSELVVDVTTSRASRSRCQHAWSARGPMPLFLTAHARRLECFDCAHRRAKRTKGTVEDRRCDRCRRTCPRGGIYPFAVQIGLVLISGGHCTNCTDAVRGVPA